MIDPTFHPRFSLPYLAEALQDTPAVLIHGPRQCGKTTLARTVGDAAMTPVLSMPFDWLTGALCGRGWLVIGASSLAVLKTIAMLALIAGG